MPLGRRFLAKSDSFYAAQGAAYVEVSLCHSQKSTPPRKKRRRQQGNWQSSSCGHPSAGMGILVAWFVVGLEIDRRRRPLQAVVPGGASTPSRGCFAPWGWRALHHVSSSELASTSFGNNKYPAANTFVRHLGNTVIGGLRMESPQHASVKASMPLKWLVAQVRARFLLLPASGLSARDAEGSLERVPMPIFLTNAAHVCLQTVAGTPWTIRRAVSPQHCAQFCAHHQTTPSVTERELQRSQVSKAATGVASVAVSHIR